MTREDVISWLKYLSDDARSKADGLVPTNIEIACGMAIDALKVQKPVEPVPAIDNVGDWLCGNCYQSVVGEEELDASGFVPVKFNFCPNCGRAVKWR